jgi:hypothetical protein
LLLLLVAPRMSRVVVILGPRRHALSHPSLSPIRGRLQSTVTFMTVDDAVCTTQMMSMTASVMMSGASGMRAVVGNIVTTSAP